MVKKEEFTTIRIKKTTKKKLDEKGTKADSYDDIILRLLKE